MAVYADTFSFECPALEPGETTPQSFPYPTLEPSGRAIRHEVQTVVLENDCLRVAIAPDLGGRVVSLFDRRFQRETLSSPVLRAGRRGACLAGGIELTLDGEERLNAMGPVDFQVQEGDDAMLLGELASGSGLSWHLRISVPPGRAAVRFEARIANRLLEPACYRGGLLIPAGVAWLAFKGMFVEEEGPGERRVVRPLDTGMMTPRQVDAWSCDLAPTWLVDPIADGDAVASLAGGSLAIEALEPMPGHKIVISVGGKTLEAPLDLFPERAVSFDVADGVEAVAILSPERIARFKWEANPAADPAAELRRELLRADSRGKAHVGLALIASRKGDFSLAMDHLDDALTVNAEDPLVWWLKAAMKRQVGEVEDRPELLNAHYLAPFEPALRAEGFLSIGHESREPSPLVGALADSPDDMVEVACLLHEAGLFEDLSRWVDECLRHREIPMLHYILADALLSDSRMTVEAAQHVQRAEKTPINQPYPWRELESQVLSRLASAFPRDSRVADLLALVTWAKKH